MKKEINKITNYQALILCSIYTQICLTGVIVNKLLTPTDIITEKALLILGGIMGILSLITIIEIIKK